MKKNPWLVIGGLLLLFVVLTAVVIGMSTIALVGGKGPKIQSKDTFLVLELNGVIFESSKFIKKLEKYTDDKDIKGILLKINSPGGTVGAAEEIFLTLQNIRKEGLPIVVYSPELNASGGYYISMAADKLVVTQGALIGSIGVIMEFANLEKLYNWANVSRYSITSGKFKDSGAEYRPMRDDEKEYFQALVNDAYAQFRQTVVDNRKLEPAIADEYLDGRVFSGGQAVKLGLADKVGTQKDAEALLKELTGVKDYELYEPKPPRRSIFDKLFPDDEDDFDAKLGRSFDKIFGTALLNRPLFLMPGHFPNSLGGGL